MGKRALVPALTTRTHGRSVLICGKGKRSEKTSWTKLYMVKQDLKDESPGEGGKVVQGSRLRGRKEYATSEKWKKGVGGETWEVGRDLIRQVLVSPVKNLDFILRVSGSLKTAHVCQHLCFYSSPRLTCAPFCSQMFLKFKSYYVTLLFKRSGVFLLSNGLNPKLLNKLTRPHMTLSQCPDRAPARCGFFGFFQLGALLFLDP